VNHQLDYLEDIRTCNGGSQLQAIFCGPLTALRGAGGYEIEGTAFIRTQRFQLWPNEENCGREETAELVAAEKALKVCFDWVIGCMPFLNTVKLDEIDSVTGIIQRIQST
jgi:hypothetical protein